MKKLVFFTIIFFHVMLFAAFPAAGAPGAACTRDANCDDGVFCNGREICRFSGIRGTGICRPGIRPCAGTVCYEDLNSCSTICRTDADCDDGIACTADRCSPGTGTCRHLAPDVDGDGHGDASCINASGTPLGDDCDDRDRNRYPGNIEVCDAAGRDEDCNIETIGTRDADGDGFVDHNCCNLLPERPGFSLCGPDCDDLHPGVHPIAPEVCNGIDDNCDYLIDEGVSVFLYGDLDGDGHGNESSGRILGCAGAPGYSTLNNDCDDTNPAVHPGSMICSQGSQGQELIGDVLICSSNSFYIPARCPMGTCIVQPNGTGVCVP